MLKGTPSCISPIFQKRKMEETFLIARVKMFYIH